MKNKFLMIVVSAAALAIALLSPGWAAQDPSLDGTDVTYKSEDGSVAGRIYKQKSLQGRSPAILVLPGRAATSAAWNG
jgi:hypothetical protein